MGYRRTRTTFRADDAVRKLLEHYPEEHEVMV